MASTFETGHAKNIAHFEDLIVFCQQFGTAYNPASAAIQLTALQAKLLAAKTAVLDSTNARTAYNNATNARERAFQDLRKLVTRIVNALSAAGAAQQTIDDARTLQRKMHGARARKKLPVSDTGKITAPETGTDSATRSVSQQSYDQLLHHFQQLISLLTSEPTYLPNESDLQTSTLITLYTNLQLANNDVMTAEAAYDIARLNRNSALRNGFGGLVGIGTQVKQYIKSIFGASSPQYKLVSGLLFR